MSDLFAEYANSKGLSLIEHGVDEVAFTRSDALNALTILREAMVPVLGGDVYLRKNEKISLAYANWYSNKDYIESNEEFLIRSLAEAESYIEKFPEDNGFTPLFVIVPRKT